MDFEAAIDSFNGFLNTAWLASTEAAVPLVWTDTPVNDLPADATGKVVSEQVVVDTEIINANQVTMGSTSNRRFRRNGLSVIRLMVPRKQGRLRLDQLAKIVYDSLEGECTPEGIEIFRLTPLRSFEAGAYMVKQINVEFEYDEIK